VLLLWWPILIPPERFSQGSDLRGFPKIIPEIRVRFFVGETCAPGNQMGGFVALMERKEKEGIK
jgi:hypothetical protein